MVGMGKKGRTVCEVAGEHTGDRESRRYKWERIGVRLSVAGKGKEEESWGLAGGEQCGRESTPAPASSSLFLISSLSPSPNRGQPASSLKPPQPSSAQVDSLSLHSGPYYPCTSSGN